MEKELCAYGEHLI
uniref:Uncharacterized protein n=1 Tax=Lepeophtheirus salmonis TaxID=72036 RepID=A0A0K2TK00_LEPSM